MRMQKKTLATYTHVYLKSRTTCQTFTVFTHSTALFCSDKTHTNTNSIKFRQTPKVQTALSHTLYNSNENTQSRNKSTTKLEQRVPALAWQAELEACSAMWMLMHMCRFSQHTESTIFRWGLWQVCSVTSTIYPVNEALCQPSTTSRYQYQFHSSKRLWDPFLIQAKHTLGSASETIFQVTQTSTNDHEERNGQD